jgi:hypothetical protein
MARFNPTKALAASKTWRQQSELVREKIKTDRIVDLLQRFVLQEEPGYEGAKIKLSPSHVKACLLLLDRVLPTLSIQDIIRHDVTEPVNYEQLLERLKRLLVQETVQTIVAKIENKPLKGEAK